MCQHLTIICPPPSCSTAFTGSTEIGKLIMAAGAKRVVPVTLELGGKSPLIVSGLRAACQLLGGLQVVSGVGRLVPVALELDGKSPLIVSGLGTATAPPLPNEAHH